MKLNYILYASLCIICITLSVGCTSHNAYPSDNMSLGNNMTVHYIDVGQGDSEFIQFPDGKSMLIDAGDTFAEGTVINYLKRQGVNNIDVVVVTHPHEDHIGGMTGVLNTYMVGRVFDSGYPHTTHIYSTMLETIDKRNIKYVTPVNGDHISIDPNVDIEVMNSNTNSTNLNDDSIVLKMTYNKVVFLFEGDASSKVEDTYAYNVGKVDILKVAHHGSGSSTSSKFLFAIKPSVSIISVGAHNDYGHPVSNTLSRLEKIGTRVYRTDKDGTVIVMSNGKTYSIQNVMG
jgi:competence protein ComEC